MIQLTFSLYLSALIELEVRSEKFWAGESHACKDVLNRTRLRIQVERVRWPRTLYDCAVVVLERLRSGGSGPIFIEPRDTIPNLSIYLQAS